MSTNITPYDPVDSQRLTIFYDLAERGELVDPSPVVLGYLGLTLYDAHAYKLGFLKRSPVQDDPSFVGLCVLRTRTEERFVYSASVCKKGSFQFTLFPNVPDIPYVPHASLRRDKPFLVFRTEIAAMLAAKQVGKEFNVVMLHSLLVDRPLLAAMQKSPVVIFNDETYWANPLKRALAHAVTFPLPYGRDFVDWILHFGGDVTSAYALAEQASKTSEPEHYLASKLLGERKTIYPAPPYEIEKVKEMRAIIQAQPSNSQVGVYITELEGNKGDRIEISYGFHNYVCCTNSSQILKDLPARGVVSPDCYTQRRLLLRHGFQGVLECTNLLQLARGNRLIKGTDPCLQNIDLPNRTKAEACLRFYQKYIQQLKLTTKAQYRWYTLMRDAQTVLYNGAYRMPYNPEQYKEIYLSIAQNTDEKWKTGLSWVNARQYGSESLPVNLHPCGSLSGRFSCTEPAMQSVPKELRKAFYSHAGMVFVSGDLSQCELRILAAIANDERYIANFQGDPHRETASKIFGKESANITTAERQIGKQVNLSIVYGIGNKALADNIGCSLAQAKTYKERMKLSYPQLAQWLHHTNAFGKDNGYVTTPSGRRIPLDVSSKSYSYSGANYVAQGTEMEIMLLAVNKLTEVFTQRGMYARVVHLIHDEIICESCPSIVHDVEEVLRDILTEAFREVLPNAPLTGLVDVSSGTCWGDLKG